MKRTRVDSISSSNNDGQNAGNPLSASSNPQVGNPTSGNSGTSQANQQTQPGNNLQNISNGQPRNAHFDTENDTIHNPRPVQPQQYTDYLQIEQDMLGAPNYQSFYFDDGSINNFAGLDFYGNGLQGMPATIYSAAPFGNGQSAMPPTPGPRALSRIGFVVPNTPIYRPQSAYAKSPGPDAQSDLKYPVLAPLMPHISHIISPTIACHLLDLYFAEPSSSLFESASPYVLSMSFCLCKMSELTFYSTHLSQTVVLASYTSKKDIESTPCCHAVGNCSDFRCFGI
jgi:hypothetical protein